MPFIAAPTPAATIAASEIGASRTRSWPNSGPIPLTCAKWPPRSKRSVPMTKMLVVAVHLLAHALLEGAATTWSGRSVTWSLRARS